MYKKKKIPYGREIQETKGLIKLVKINKFIELTHQFELEINSIILITSKSIEFDFLSRSIYAIYLLKIKAASERKKKLAKKESFKYDH